MKFNNFAKSLFLYSSVAFLGALGYLLAGEISKGEAIEMIDDDHKKITISKNYNIFYDYEFINYKINYKILDSTLKALDTYKENKDSVEYVIVKFGFQKDKLNNFVSFSMAISGILSNGNPISDKFDIPIGNWGENFSKNYREAFNSLRRRNVIGIYGHRHDNDEGVIFPIDSATNFINKHPDKDYYVYPAFKKNGLFKFNFTTVIFTNDPLLRRKLVSPGFFELKEGEDFYGDKGTACCQ